MTSSLRIFLFGFSHFSSANGVPHPPPPPPPTLPPQLPLLSYCCPTFLRPSFRTFQLLITSASPFLDSIHSFCSPLPFLPSYAFHVLLSSIYSSATVLTLQLFRQPIASFKPQSRWNYYLTFWFHRFMNTSSKEPADCDWSNLLAMTIKADQSFLLQLEKENGLKVPFGAGGRY